MTVEIPRGDLVRSRVVSDLAVTLETLLADGWDGYLVVEPGDALLLDDETRVVVTFASGVPVLAYDPGGDAGGRRALASFADPGPFQVEVYALDPAALEPAHERAADDLRVPPGLPAERLADDGDLAARTREAAPDDRLEDGADPLEAFLADEERIAAIREEARVEARSRAEEWGLADQLADGSTSGVSDGDAAGSRRELDLDASE